MIKTIHDQQKDSLKAATTTRPGENTRNDHKNFLTVPYQDGKPENITYLMKTYLIQRKAAATLFISPISLLCRVLFAWS